MRPAARDRVVALRQNRSQSLPSWAFPGWPTASYPPAWGRLCGQLEPVVGGQTVGPPSVPNVDDGRCDRYRPPSPCVCDWTCPCERSRGALAGHRPQPACGSRRARPRGASPPLAIKGQYLNRLGLGVLLEFGGTGLGIKGVKVLGRVVDDLLDLRLAQAHAGLRCDVVSDRFKGYLGRLGRHPFLQPMRVVTRRQVQLGIVGKEATYPALALARACDPNGAKDALIAGFHVIALGRTHHPIGAAHHVCKPTSALVIQMILPQQPE